MRNATFILLVCLLFVCPAVALAHALSPTHYPLGHIPVLLTKGRWVYLLMILLTVLAETIVLWGWARRFGFLGNLWRAAVLYLVARASETAMLYAFLYVSFFQSAGWSSSVVENYGSLAICLAVGLIPKVPAGLLLYRRTDLKASVIAIAVGTASVVGYLAAVGCGMTIFVILYRRVPF